MKIRSGILLMSGLLAGSLWADASVLLTLYKQKAFVREMRVCDLPSREGRIILNDLPHQLEPESVTLTSMTAGENFTVREQVFQKVPEHIDRLYGACSGKTVQIITRSGTGLSGTLMPRISGEKVLKIEDQLIVIPDSQIDHVILPDAMTNALISPTLEFVVDNRAAARQQLVLEYRTGQFGWQAFYRGVLNGDETQMNLSASVMIQNHSGKSYEKARVTLVAGDLARVDTPPVNLRMGKMMAEGAAMDAGEESVFEYHTYALPKKLSIGDGENRQFNLMAGLSLPVEKVYQYDAGQHAEKVRVMIQGKNTSGLALPEGRMQLFVESPPVMIGESFLPHTACEGEVTLTAGYAFDISVERVELSQKNIGSRARETSWKLTFKNAKSTAVQIVVDEHFYNQWNIVSSSLKSIRKDSRTAQWLVSVPEQGEAVLAYTVQTRWQ